MNLLGRVLLLIVSFGLLAADARAADEADVIRFATVSTNYRVALEELAARYEALHPEVKVELTFIAQEFETWIRTRMAAGGDLVPDIYNGNYTQGYGEQGKWVSLDPYLRDTNPYTGERWVDGLDAQAIERYRVAGSAYLLPMDHVDIAIFYNQDLFRRLGLSVPSTWEEFLSVSAQIREAGVVPIAIGGDAASFWAGDMGWLVRLMGDAYLRDLVPVVACRPGDWDYDPERNAEYAYDPADPYSDMMVLVSRERMYAAIRDRTFDFTSPKFARVYERLAELSQHFQPGFMGVDSGSAMQMFYARRAAMCVLASPAVTGILHDFADLAPEDRFAFGNFFFPPVTGDPLVCGPFRGVGGGGTLLVAMKKDDPQHEANVIDFLRFITTPEAGHLLVDRTLGDEQAIVGPMLIKDVRLPPELEERFEVFQGHGFERLNFRGLADEQESVNEWVIIAQEFLGGRLPLDAFCLAYQDVMERAVDRVVLRDGHDMDPTTEDPIPNLEGERNPWNPFENGSLMLLILILLFGVFAATQIRRATGHGKHVARVAYALLFPTFFILGAFNYFPALSGLYHAFTEWEEGRAAVFSGLDNFTRLIHDPAMYRGIWNMVVLLLAGLFKAIVAPFAAAELILFLASDRMRYAFRTMFLLPMVVPGMVAVLIWRFIYDPGTGMLNQALQGIGLERFTANWLGDPNLALGSIIFMGFPWVGAFGLLIYMAGLMQIPDSVYEAYSMESTNLLRRIVTIDVPLVGGQIRMLTILTFIASVQDFQTILVMTRGGPGMATYVPALRMYYQAFNYGHFGYGAAIGLVLFLIILLITVINMKVLKPVEAL